jgi:glycogen debranching enzyme
MDLLTFRQSIYNNLLELATDEGINASGKEDVYGCIFGRDSAITILKIVKATSSNNVYTSDQLTNLHAMCKRGLLTLVSLQGKEINIESGEEPGKFIHEFRKEKYERLLTLPKPWYIYPDGILRNYDSIDSTPLGLIAIYKYWKATHDTDFLLRVLPAVEAGLNWIITYGDLDKDYLLEYELNKERTHGGLPVQSWTDSEHSMLNDLGEFPLYPIAPVEVQGYAWLALNLWADFYGGENTAYANTASFANKLRSFALNLKTRFNETFLFSDDGLIFPAQALDGNKRQIRTVTGNPLLLLWATHEDETGKKEAIINTEHIADMVKRSFMKDLFDSDAGIRTMTEKSPTYNPYPDSYHNGSFWPKLNGMSHEGLIHWGYENEAALLKTATLKPLLYFGTPIELYIKNIDGTYAPFKNEFGQESCKNQAWSAATALDLLSTV